MSLSPTWGITYVLLIAGLMTRIFIAQTKIKAMKRVVSLFLIILFAFSCNNEEEDAINEIEDDIEPAVTPIGFPIGDPVEQEIGSGGGTISSADGKLDVTVPNGAVTTNTLFSIQAITNFCPGGRDAYRLLPESSTFAQPVTLTFHYTDEEVENTLINLLGIAFQGVDGIWYRMPAVVDDVAKTIHCKATHFTDWSVLSQLQISPITPRVPEIEPGKTLELVLVGAEDDSPKPPPTPSPDPNEDDLPSLPQPAPFKARWFVNGQENGNSNVGTITVMNGTHATYHAPARAPANRTVAISAELSDFRTWDFTKGKSYNKVILFKYVRIGEYEFTLRIEETSLKYIVCSNQATYKDVVEMDIKVKGEQVTVGNFVNKPPTLSPTVFESGTCTITCNAGTVGSLNVKSGTGERWPAPHPQDGYYRFNLHLTNESQGEGASVKFSCPQGDLPPPPGQFPESDLYCQFILSDSPQEIKGPGIVFTLTPKK
jgi:hypothetical protein